MAKTTDPLYRADLIVWRMTKLGLTVDQAEEMMTECRDTISRARTGRNLNVKTLFSVTDRLGIIRKFLFDYELKESQFGRAVRKDAKKWKRLPRQ